MTVIDEIAAERRRQIEVEGWTPEHDDQHAEIERLDRREEATYRAGMNRKMHRYCATFTNKGLYNFGVEFWAESGDAHQVAEDIGGQLGAEFCFIDKAGDKNRDREWEETSCRARADANRARLNGRKSVYEAAEKRAAGKE